MLMYRISSFPQSHLRALPPSAVLPPVRHRYCRRRVTVLSLVYVYFLEPSGTGRGIVTGGEVGSTTSLLQGATVGNCSTPQ